MTKGEILKRIATIGREISLLFGELSAELSETDSRAWLRFVKNEPRAISELKKMPKSFILSGRGGGRTQQKRGCRRERGNLFTGRIYRLFEIHRQGDFKNAKII